MLKPGKSHAYNYQVFSRAEDDTTHRVFYHS